MDVIINRIGQGNPGALTVITLVMKEHPTRFAEFAEMCLLRNLTGPDLWDEFKRKYRQNISEFLAGTLTQQGDGRDTQ